MPGCLFSVLSAAGAVALRYCDIGNEKCGVAAVFNG